MGASNSVRRAQSCRDVRSALCATGPAFEGGRLFCTGSSACRLARGCGDALRGGGDEQVTHPVTHLAPSYTPLTCGFYPSGAGGDAGDALSGHFSMYLSSLFSFTEE